MNIESIIEAGWTNSGLGSQKTSQANLQNLSFEDALLGAMAPTRDVQASNLDDSISEFAKGRRASGGSVLSAGDAKDLVKLLNMTGFLDKVVDKLVDSSGMGDWINAGMQQDLKFELGDKLADMFEGMSWSEVMHFLMELSLKLEQQSLLEPMDEVFTGEDRMDGEKLGSVHEQLLREISNGLDQLKEDVLKHDIRQASTRRSAPVWGSYGGPN